MISGEFAGLQDRTAPHNDGLTANTLQRNTKPHEKQAGGLVSDDPFHANPVFGSISDLQQKRAMQVVNFRDGQRAQDDKLFPFEFDISREGGPKTLSGEQDTSLAGGEDELVQVDGQAEPFQDGYIARYMNHGVEIGKSVSPSPQELAALQQSQPEASNWREMFYEVNAELTKAR